MEFNLLCCRWGTDAAVGHSEVSCSHFHWMDKIVLIRWNEIVLFEWQCVLQSHECFDH